ncbi:MAG: histidine kinase [Bacillota bacterium]
MAHRLRATHKQKTVGRQCPTMGGMEILQLTKDKQYQNELLTKRAALERLSGVKNSGKTYYRELKKSVAEMQKCNLSLGMESLRLKTALLSLKVMSDNLAMLNKGSEPLLQAIGESLGQITDAQYIVMLARTDRFVSFHLPQPCLEKELLDAYFYAWLDKMKARDFACPYGMYQRHLKEEPELNFLAERYGLHDMVAFPMIMREKILGFILLFFHEYKGDEGCQSILQILGNQTAIALENARLFEDMLRLKEKAESHYRVACAQKEQLEQKNRELKNMYDILFRSREEQILFRERSRIAGDLHDNVLQILFAIGLHLEWCLKELPEQTPVYAKLKYLEGLVNKASQEIRKVVCEFGSGESHSNFQESIESLARDLNQAGSVRIYVHTFGQAPLLPSVVRNIAYRIVQEALVNALRHANATWINIHLVFTEISLEIKVMDNGIGVPDVVIENLYQDDKKFGLKNMMQRAAYLNGTLKIGRSDTGGTEVFAVIPIEGVG